jgi:hypothetical protein
MLNRIFSLFFKIRCFYFSPFLIGIIIHSWLLFRYFCRIPSSDPVLVLHTCHVFIRSANARGRLLGLGNRKDVPLCTRNARKNSTLLIESVIRLLFVPRDRQCHGLGIINLTLNSTRSSPKPTDRRISALIVRVVMARPVYLFSSQKKIDSKNQQAHGKHSELKCGIQMFLNSVPESET